MPAEAPSSELLQRGRLQESAPLAPPPTSHNPSGYQCPIALLRFCFKFFQNRTYFAQFGVTGDSFWQQWKNTKKVMKRLLGFNFGVFQCFYAKNRAQGPKFRFIRVISCLCLYSCKKVKNLSFWIKQYQKKVKNEKNCQNDQKCSFRAPVD